MEEVKLKIKIHKHGKINRIGFQSDAARKKVNVNGQQRNFIFSIPASLLRLESRTYRTNKNNSFLDFPAYEWRIRGLNGYFHFVIR